MKSIYVKRSGAFLALLLVCAATEGVQKRVRVTREQVAKVWVGLSEDELHMIRLILKPEGDGQGALSFMNEKPCRFRISSWSYEEGQVEITLATPSDECASGTTLRGKIHGSALQLTMARQGWRRRASLRREEDLLDRWLVMKDET